MKTYQKKTSKAYVPRFSSNGNINPEFTPSVCKNLDVTAHQEPLTQKEKEDLEDYMQAKKWGSVSF